MSKESESPTTPATSIHAEKSTHQYAQKKGEVVLRDHQYDGIQEFDQKLPNWWLLTFYAAIVLFVAWWFCYYQLHWFHTDHQRVISAMTSIQEKKNQELEATLASLDDLTLVTKWSSDPAILAEGEATFTANCIACHGADLSATMNLNGQKLPLPGLSLVDGAWKYGGKPMEIFRLINEGTPANSPGHNGARMQAWGQVLSPKKVAEVVAFLIAKNPNDFKAIH